MAAKRGAAACFFMLCMLVIPPALAGITKSAGSGASNHDIYLGCADTSDESKPNADTAALRAARDGRSACSTFRDAGKTGCVDDCKNGGYCCQIGFDRPSFDADDMCAK